MLRQVVHKWYTDRVCEALLISMATSQSPCNSRHVTGKRGKAGHQVKVCFAIGKRHTQPEMMYDSRCSYKMNCKELDTTTVADCAAG